MCHLSRPGNITMKKKYQRTLCVCFVRCMSPPWYNARTGLACWRNFRCQPFGAECENMKILTHFATQICSLAIAIMIVSIFLNIKFYACQHLCVYFPIGTFNINLPTTWSKEIRYQFFSARASGSLRPDRLFAQWFATIRENSFVWRFGKYWIFLSYPTIIIISLTFCFTCLLQVGAVDVLVSPESGPTAAFLEVLPCFCHF